MIIIDSNSLEKKVTSRSDKCFYNERRVTIKFISD